MSNFVYRCASYRLVGAEPDEKICLDSLDRSMNWEQACYVSLPCPYPPGMVRAIDLHKLRCALTFYHTLEQYARSYTGKASILLDYDHSRCVLQLENLCGLSFDKVCDRERFSALLTLSDGFDLSARPDGRFLFTLRFNLFWTAPRSAD